MFLSILPLVSESSLFTFIFGQSSFLIDWFEVCIVHHLVYSLMISLFDTMRRGAANHLQCARRVGKGISAQTSHRTVREALTSYGSCRQISTSKAITPMNKCIRIKSHDTF